MALSKYAQNPTAIGSIIAAFAFLIYLLTLAPTVTFMDSGELVAVTSTLGVAHPSGYPLFTLIGWLFTKLPIGTSEAYRANIMAALFCAAGLFIFFKLLMFLIGQNEKETPPKYDRLFVLSAAAFGTLILAFSQTFWQQAVSIEVYSLHCLLIIASTYVFLKAIKEKGSSTGPGNILFRVRYWIFFSLLLGLSFSNHLTTIMLAPAFLYLFFSEQGINRDAFKKILLMIVPFFLGLSLYLYLPIRASQNPILNWGNPSTWENFIWHLSGKIYRGWLFSSTDVTYEKSKHFFSMLPGEFAYFPIIFAIAGSYLLFRESRRLFYFTSILFATCIVYAINYNIPDIGPYFLLAYMIIALWSGFGATRILSMIRKYSAVNIFTAVIPLLAIVLITTNYRYADESRNYLAEDYTMNMFNSIEPDGILITRQWDYFTSPSLYFQLVKNIRRDVFVIDGSLLYYTWYINHLKKNYPLLVELSQQEIDAFLRIAHKVERGLSVPNAEGEFADKYYRMLNSIIDRNIGSRPVYVTYELKEFIDPKYSSVPEGLALRLYNDKEYHAMKPFNFIFRDIDKPYIKLVRKRYSEVLTSRGLYELNHGRLDEASSYFDRALAFDPSYARELEEVIRYMTGLKEGRGLH